MSYIFLKCPTFWGAVFPLVLRASGHPGCEPVSITLLEGNNQYRLSMVPLLFLSPALEKRWVVLLHSSSHLLSVTEKRIGVQGEAVGRPWEAADRHRALLVILPSTCSKQPLPPASWVGLPYLHAASFGEMNVKYIKSTKGF